MPDAESQPPAGPARSMDGRLLWQVLRNMGPRYVFFRAWWEFRRRTGLLAKRFPTHPPRQDFISMADWRAGTGHFLLQENVAAHLPALPAKEHEKLQAEAERIRMGEVKFFSATWYTLATDWNWRTHPETGYKYPLVHWTKIEDFSARAGDIKFVWEKARFSWVYTLARAEAHGGPDAGGYVLGQMAHFIKHNPINRGPQHRCAQETSLRIMAWSFALSYWRHHPALTERLFSDIMHSLRWQLHRVRMAINFSRISVRNNHAITETAMLALAHRLFPFWPETAKWAEEGLAWLQEEVDYQFYDRGGYLMHSTNYHRVVVQTLTLVLSPAGLGEEALPPALHTRLQATLAYLQALQDTTTGWMPNMGNNDGALFFPLSSAHYRDYRPALHALAAALGQPSPYSKAGLWAEEAAWWGLSAPLSEDGSNTEPFVFVGDGVGVAKHNQGQTATILRSAAYKDRPGQADNLHLDLWHAGRNLLRDSGTYKYNTDANTLSKFAGALGHNSFTLGAYDHMLKGPRFIWFYWTKEAELDISPDGRVMRAAVQAFLHLTPKGIWLRRTVTIDPEALIWIIEDEAEVNLGFALKQHWHPTGGYEHALSIVAEDPDTGASLEAEHLEGAYSSFYGRKQEAPHLVFSTTGKRIRTTISIKVPITSGQYPDQSLDEH